MATKFEKLFNDYLKNKTEHEKLTKQMIEEVNKKLEGKLKLRFEREESLNNLEKTEDGIVLHYYELDYNERHLAKFLLE